MKKEYALIGRRVRVRGYDGAAVGIALNGDEGIVVRLHDDSFDGYDYCDVRLFTPATQVVGMTEDQPIPEITARIDLLEPVDIWPLRFARAKSGRIFHLIEYDGSVPMGVRGGVSLCGSAPEQWHQTDGSVRPELLRPADIPWPHCEKCTKIAQETGRMQPS